ncbi:MAG: phosphatidate cytidylyltransferase [Proteobacteria bacterium]|nr:phosphatidate cytidylyltransferase [Pseudomonadota bacterium]
MLKTRVITAVVLLAVLLAILFSGSLLAFQIGLAVFFAAAMWECFRLFQNKQAIPGAAIWTAAFIFILFNQRNFSLPLLFAVCVAIWMVRLIPSLATGLPSLEGWRNRLLNGIYGIAILGCFLAIFVLFQHSPTYLLSVMAIVWIADIGAYFVGKACGKRKLAPSISPGKSWEGAMGGWVCVLLIAAASTAAPWLQDSFAVQLLAKWGWVGFIAAMSLLVAASIVGDLVESQLKRRAGMKDSSNLLPGHGGVLDRIDALIPVLPLAALLSARF